MLPLLPKEQWQKMGFLIRQSDIETGKLHNNAVYTDNMALQRN
jgi:hypothetical protein